MKTYKNDVNEVYATDSYSRVQLGVHQTSMPDTRAQYALDLIKHIGAALMLDAHPGAARMTASEVVTVASDISKAAFDEFSKRGWIVDVPSMEILADEARENRGRN